LLFDGHRGLGLRPIATLLRFALLCRQFLADLDGSLVAGMPALETARQIRWLRAWLL